MEKFFNEEMVGQLKQVFERLENNVTLALFTTEELCPTCDATKAFLEEISATSEKIKVKHYDINEDKQLAKDYDVTLTPTIVLLDGDDKYRNIKFSGLPAGHEINAFLAAILEVSGFVSEVPQEYKDRIAKIDKPIDIKVFVTLACPHCAGAVEKAHKLAIENPNISAVMIEANTFGEMADKYNVSGVPKVVINDEFEFVGNQTIDTFLDTIEKAL